MDLVLPEMLNYLSDESSLVKTACFQSLVDIVDLLDDEDTKFYVLKNFVSFVEYGLSIKDELYLIKISEKLGTILTALRSILNTQYKTVFLDTFYQICKNENLFAKRVILSNY